jgi:hypothetical protein
MTLDYNHTGLYTVSKNINKNAYKLDLPKLMQNHSIFDVSQLDHYTPLVIGQSSLQSRPATVDDSVEWDVKQILESKQHYQKPHYCVQWAERSPICPRSEPTETLETAVELINKFH